MSFIEKLGDALGTVAGGIGAALLVAGVALSGPWAIAAIAVGAALVGGALAAEALMPDISSTPESINNNLVQKVMDPNYELPVVYGTAELAGNLVFYNTRGKDNNILDMVVVVCEGEIEGFQEVYMDNAAVPVFSAGDGVFEPNVGIQAADGSLYGRQRWETTFRVPYNSNRGARVNYGAGGWNYGHFTNAETLYNLMKPTADAVGQEISFNEEARTITLRGSYGDTNNGFAMVICRGAYEPQVEVEGIDDWGEPYRRFEPPYSRWFGITNGANNNVYLRAVFHNGSHDQPVDGSLLEEYPNDIYEGDRISVRKYLETDKFSGIAYAHIIATFNRDLFNSNMPEFKFKVKGKKVYSPNKSVYGYSTNPAYCLLDYLTKWPAGHSAAEEKNKSYGKNLSWDSIDVASFNAAASACNVVKQGKNISDETITYPTYAISGVLSTSNKIVDGVKELLRSMNGALPYYDGRYYVKVMGAGDPVVTFAEDDIVGGVSVSTSDKKDRYNKVKVTFPDSSNHWKTYDAIAVDDDLIAADGEVLETSITTPLISYYPRAKDIAELTLSLSRKDLAVSFVTTLKGLRCIPGDIIGITYEIYGWDNKEFRLNSLTLTPEGLVEITATQHDDLLYSTAEHKEIEYTNGSTLKSPLKVESPVIQVIATADKFAFNNNGIVPRIEVSWFNREEYPDKFVIYYKKESDSAYKTAGTVDANSDSLYYIEAVDENESYVVGVVCENGFGVKSIMALAQTTVASVMSLATWYYPEVTGLELSGEGFEEGKGNDVEFTEPDIHIRWNEVSSRARYEIGSSTLEAMGGKGERDFSLEHYRVSVYHGADSTPRETYNTKNNNFSYLLSDNTKNGGGTPSRSVRFEIIAVGSISGVASGESRVPARLTVENPPPIPVSATAIANYRYIVFSYVLPNIPDFDGALVWISKDSNFIPSSSTLVYSGKETDNILIDNLDTGGTYYIKYAIKDTFIEKAQKDGAGLVVATVPVNMKTIPAVQGFTTIPHYKSFRFIKNLLSDQDAANLGFRIKDSNDQIIFDTLNNVNTGIVEGLEDNTTYTLQPEYYYAGG